MNFENYQDTNLEDCIKLFDKNCPQFFAENERQDYINYLCDKKDSYKIGYSEGDVVAAFGIGVNEELKRARITWIMVCPFAKGQGIGNEMMAYAKEFVLDKKIKIIDISASHISAPFFEKFGAVTTKITHDGWGPNMHKVDMNLTL